MSYRSKIEEDAARIRVTLLSVERNAVAAEAAFVAARQPVAAADVVLQAAEEEHRKGRTPRWVSDLRECLNRLRRPGKKREKPEVFARHAPPADDDTLVERIEFRFEVPVYVTQEQQHELFRIVESICRAPANTPVGKVHWLAGWGSRPIWSQADARIFGWATDADAPESGEPTFDDSVLFGESCCREERQ